MEVKENLFDEWKQKEGSFLQGSIWFGGEKMFSSFLTL